MTWQPSAEIDTLKKRSHLLQKVRAFFLARGVTEVDVPVLMRHSVTDVHLDSVAAQVNLPGRSETETYYLQTSPEFAMKRLLCAGSGDIFYLGKAFRDGDLSSRHQVEFTMLEWYRVGFSLADLIDEVVSLIQSVLSTALEPLEVEKMSYQAAFSKYAGIDDVFSADTARFRTVLEKRGVPKVIGLTEQETSLWEQLVLTEVIEPQLGQDKISCLSHFPASQAALSKVNPQSPQVCERFEVYVDGLELANGYDELQDRAAHVARFRENQRQRKQMHKSEMSMDESLLTALDFGLPQTSGVALGFDRLAMLALRKQRIDQVIPFALD